ncbi:MAG: thioredoxin family protein, partial [Myxococcota bacterium]
MKIDLPSGLVAVVKRDCPTCELVVPVLAELAARGALSIYSQDDPEFPEGLAVQDDRELELSYHHDIEAVPTLLRVEEGREVERTEGWHRGDWEKLTGLSGLGRDLPDWRPGCGSLSQLPEQRAALRVRFESDTLRARRIPLAPLEDVYEALHERGWSDGLPMIPPTPER